MHIHLDPVGGVAGDMFAAALLDTWPDFSDQVIDAIRTAGLGDDIIIAHHSHDDGVLTGSRFEVSKSHADTTSDNHGHQHANAHGLIHYNHTHWADLRKLLEQSALADSIKKHVIGIFSELAQAEARVHGKDIETVTFHEVGNWDSIADIVAAATLIDRIGAKSWSIGSLPIGNGRVKTAHGELPVPAPATSLLLDGFAFHDDGRAGERITPTGAAILRYLSPLLDIGRRPRTLRKIGFGFGTKRFEGMSNVLRVLAFETTAQPKSNNEDTVGILQFEIDDQTGEELAVALEYIRNTQGVIDVTQTTVMGKKGRIMTGIQVLAKPDAMDATIETCFLQTTTLGIRTRVETRTILQRHEVKNPDGTRIKIAKRPGGETAKADIDDVADNASSHRNRFNIRDKAENEAIETQRLRSKKDA